MEADQEAAARAAESEGVSGPDGGGNSDTTTLVALEHTHRRVMVTATRAVARPTNDDLNLASARCWRDDENKSLHHCPPRISAMTAPTAEETAAALCDDVAAAIHPDLGVLGDNADRVRAVADGMLARLDELDAMLRSLRDDGAEQRAALEPALEALAGGLARDFAYVDSVEDTVRDVGNAVGAMEERLSALEQGRFRRARVADAENARASIESLFAKMGGVTASIGERAAGVAGEVAAAGAAVGVPWLAPASAAASAANDDDEAEEYWES